MGADRHLKQRQENEVEFGRIVAFSDGVFSIAITLLVLNISIKKGLMEGQIDNALWDQRASPPSSCSGCCCTSTRGAAA